MPVFFVGWFSLIPLAAQLQPAVSMTPAGVAVRPVDDAAARVRLVLTAEGDVVGSLQIGPARREVDVMRDQYRFARADVEDEALMAAALGIVLQHFFHLPRAAYRRAATVLRDDLIQRGVSVARFRCRLRRERRRELEWMMYRPYYPYWW